VAEDVQVARRQIETKWRCSGQMGGPRKRWRRRAPLASEIIARAYARAIGQSGAGEQVAG
jgi:hypothetical protein